MTGQDPAQIERRAVVGARGSGGAGPRAVDRACIHIALSAWCLLRLPASGLCLCLLLLRGRPRERATSQSSRPRDTRHHDDDDGLVRWWQAGTEGAVTGATLVVVVASRALSVKSLSLSPLVLRTDSCWSTAVATTGTRCPVSATASAASRFHRCVYLLQKPAAPQGPAARPPSVACLVWCRWMGHALMLQ